MSTTPLLTQALARAHERELLEQAALKRCAVAAAQPSPARRVLVEVGSLLIAAGERLGGIRAARTGDLAGAAR
jgi:hypothetical protein